MNGFNFHRDFFGKDTKSIFRQLELFDLQRQQQDLKISQIAQRINIKELTELFTPKSTVDLILQNSATGKINYEKINDLIGKNSGLAEIDRKALTNITAELERNLRLAHITQTTLQHRLRFTDNIRSIPKFIDLEKLIYDKFSGFSTAYSNLSTSTEEIIAQKPESAKVICELSALEVLNSAEVLESVSAAQTEVEVNQREDETEDQESFNTKISGQQAAFAQLLTTINSQDLFHIWEGANIALNSIDNPDYARHFASSLRELFTQILHRLSPDDEIRKWTRDENHFHSGRPTRRARLLYICRGINGDKFSDFVKKDIDSTLALVDLFNSATHEPVSPFTHNQLETMLTKMGGTINFLVETWLLNE